MDLRKIVCIDDDPFIGLIVEAAFENVSVEVVAYTSGVRALERLVYARPQLVLLDFVMPDMDGVQVLRRLKANPATADIPVVFLTGAALEDHVDFYHHEGAVHVIPKPFDPGTLAERVQSIWAEIHGRAH